VEHGSNGLLVPPGTPDSLAQAIRYLADDPQLRSEMSSRNRVKAEATLEWAQVTQRYLSIYEAVAHQLPAPSLVTAPAVSPL
jgi:glycosyltransferase involved in cell wall biosynthesis